jgi:MFS family permease
MLPLVMAIIGDIVPPADRGRWQGLIGASFGLASIIGPAAGGWIAEVASWRWVFYVNLPLGLLALITVALTLNIPHKRREPLPIDLLGALTVSVGIVSGLLVTVWGGRVYPWGSLQVLLLGLFSATMLLLFVLVERRAADPVIPLILFRNPVFAVFSAASLLMSIEMFGTIVYIPFSFRE